MVATGVGEFGSVAVGGVFALAFAVFVPPFAAFAASRAQARSCRHAVGGRAFTAFAGACHVCAVGAAAAAMGLGRCVVAQLW